MRIREPTADWYGVLGVEDIRGWRVVDDDGVFEVASNLGQVFDVVSLMVVATFAEKTMVDNVVDVQLVQQRITVLRIVSIWFAKP